MKLPSCEERRQADKVWQKEELPLSECVINAFNVHRHITPMKTASAKTINKIRMRALHDFWHQL